MPPLMPENEDAELVYLMVQDQYIMAPMGGPVAINQVAIHDAIRLYDVADPVDCFERVVATCRTEISKINDKAGK